MSTFHVMMCFLLGPQ